MRHIRSADPEARYGQVGETWGNLLLPVGAFATYDLFRFKDAPAGAPTFRVTRILSVPRETDKRLYYYESLTR